MNKLIVENSTICSKRASDRKAVLLVHTKHMNSIKGKEHCISLFDAKISGIKKSNETEEI